MGQFFPLLFTSTIRANVYFPILLSHTLYYSYSRNCQSSHVQKYSLHKMFTLGMYLYSLRLSKYVYRKMGKHADLQRLFSYRSSRK